MRVLQDVAALLDRGVYDNEVLHQEGWVTALKYEDEITDDLKKRTGGKVGGGRRSMYLHLESPGHGYHNATCVDAWNSKQSIRVCCFLH